MPRRSSPHVTGSAPRSGRPAGLSVSAVASAATDPTAGPPVPPPGAAAKGPAEGNLPAETSRLIGRRRELAQGRKLLSQARLLTVTGPGGIGKTRLALRLAQTVRRSYPAGAWLIDLTAATTAGDVALAVLTALGLRPGPGVSPVGGLTEHLRSQRALIVLDTCEHVLQPAALLIRTLLEAAPSLQVVATSRQALGVDGEHLLLVPPLPAPLPDSSTSGGGVRNDALELFTDRAVSVLGAFRPSTDAALAAATICHRLEGIPLAIELAASRLRVLTCEQILDRLDEHRLAFLTGGGRTSPPHRRSLQAGIDWSYELCSDREQELWARLSVFRTAFGLAAVEAVCTDETLPRAAALDLVATLVDKSVLSREDHDGQVTYRMLGTVRRYGERHLQERGSRPDFRRRHLDHHRARLRQAEAEWFTARQTGWVARLQREAPEIGAVLRFCSEEPGAADLGMEVVGSAWRYLLGTGGPLDERDRLALVLDAGTDPTPARARALRVDGLLALFAGDIAGGELRAAECQELALAMDRSAGRAEAAQLAGLAAVLRREPAKALAPLEGALARYRALGDSGETWATLHLLSLAASLCGDDRAEEMCREALALCDAHGVELLRPHALWAVALQRWLEPDIRRAVEVLRECVRAGRSSGNRLLAEQALDLLARADLLTGSPTEEAARLGAVRELWLQAAVPLAAVDPSTVPVGGDSDLRRASSEHHLLGSPAGAATEPADHSPRRILTGREYEVALLLRQGLSDRQIAARLVISLRTAQGHVHRILRKSGFTSRTQVATWVQARGAG
ncbi:LuxR C-terminal-related transcriptional regulator [Kitasatospora sp. NPDC049258]|uniref:ATP-binding protein n=1 Tax=Kitasatospora sp. NPDC049258 TaxID=3155394 RepID=UPI00341C2CF6